MTNAGLPEEARVFAKELSVVAGRIPAVGVLGNHEYDAGQEDEIRHILTDIGVTLLDGDAHETHGVGFASVKGFGGGFGERALQAWGEEIVKCFVHEAVAEALNHYTVAAVFHGHAHRGRPEGCTRNDVPVYNVAMPLLAHTFPDRPPFRLLELRLVTGPGE